MKKILLLAYIMIILIMDSHGQNVGIGNSDPASILDISGDLALREGSPMTVVAGANTLTLPAAKNSVYRLTGGHREHSASAALAAAMTVCFSPSSTPPARP